MDKKESTLFNMVFTLFVITAVSSASLGFMYELTKEPKAAAEWVKLNFAIKAVLPDFDNDPVKEVFRIESYDGGERLICYPAIKNEDLTGIAVKTWTTKGFSGMVRLMVGFDYKGNIINITVLEQKETPGLGTKMVDAEFKDQYNGLNPGADNLAVKKDGGKIDGITAATISARAFSDAVDRAYRSVDNAGMFVK